MLSSERYAIAIDLGTTTIAAAIATLPGGQILGKRGSLNPQRIHGLDVVSRLEYACRSSENLEELKTLVNSELSRLAGELIAAAGVDAAKVGMVAIAGNPTMSHLLLGLPVERLARPPYRPEVTTGQSVDTGSLGWELKTSAYIFPSPGGFIGGDTIAFLYGLGFPAPGSPSPDPALFIDLGTNGEIALLSGGRLFATSAAAGPAFEAGNLACGMAALDGAIDQVSASVDKLELRIIGGEKPLGLCGSGILDTVVLLLKEKILDISGRLLDPDEVQSALGNRLIEVDGERSFLLYRDASRLISLTQKDIRQIQLAKGAVRAGIDVLLKRAGVTGEEIREVVITGSFGASLTLDNLESIGVLSKSMVKNARFVREGALSGVLSFISAAHGTGDVELLGARIKVFPLSGIPLFEQHFLEQMNFPEGL